jgi:hypothetical protein
MLQAGRLRVRIPVKSLDFNLSVPSSRIMPSELAQPSTEMSIRNIRRDKAGQARKTDNLTAIYGLIY